jgi:hypothetical protein
MKTVTSLLLFIALPVLLFAEPGEWIGKTIPRIDLRTGASYDNAIIREITAHGIIIEHEGEKISISRYALRGDAAHAMGFGVAGHVEIKRGEFRVVKVMKTGNMIVRQHHPEAAAGSMNKFISEITNSTPKPAHDGTQYFMRGAADFPIADRELFHAHYVTTEETEDLDTVDGGSVRMRVIHLLKSHR